MAALKAADGSTIFVHGSSDLIQTLLQHGLVDELRVWIFPVVVGSGKRFFGSGTVPSASPLPRDAVLLGQTPGRSSRLPRADATLDPRRRRSEWIGLGAV